MSALYSEVNAARFTAIQAPDAADVVVVIDSTGVHWSHPDGTHGSWAPDRPEKWAIPIAAWSFSPQGAASATIDVPVTTPSGVARLTVSRSGVCRVVGP